MSLLYWSDFWGSLQILNFLTPLEFCETMKDNSH